MIIKTNDFFMSIDLISGSITSFIPGFVTSFALSFIANFTPSSVNNTIFNFVTIFALNTITSRIVFIIINLKINFFYDKQVIGENYINFNIYIKKQSRVEKFY